MQHFIEKYTRLTGKRIKSISPAALERLEARDWPGNVRELENVIERAVVLATSDLIEDSDITRDADKAQSQPAPIRFRVGQPLGDLEREAILRTLKAVNGNKDAAAGILGIGVATLYRRLKGMEEARDGDTDS